MVEDIQIGRYLDISRDRVFKNVFGKSANNRGPGIPQRRVPGFRYREPSEQDGPEGENERGDGGGVAPEGRKRQYYSYMTTERDIRNQIDFAAEQGEARGEARGRAEGQAEGEAKERLKAARNFKSLGVSVDIISKATGLSEVEIAAL